MKAQKTFGHSNLNISSLIVQTYRTETMVIYQNIEKRFVTSMFTDGM
jgi:hypothetical protein